MLKKVRGFKWGHKIFILCIILGMNFLGTKAGASEAILNKPIAWGGTFTNPIVSEDTPDQSIIFKDGFYYMTYTVGNKIPLMKSRTLDFRNAEKKFIFTPSPGLEYSEALWAPELEYLDGKWVIYFTACNGDPKLRRTYAIEANTQDPMGEWTFKGKITDTTDKWAIDAAVFELNSKKYMVWSGWEGDVNVRQNLYIAPMSDRYTISGSRIEIACPTYDWETVGDPDVMEGPQPLSRNGKVFIIYSCSGSWTPDYKLGMISVKDTDNPLVASNWTHYTSPVFKRNDDNQVYGPGHCTFTQSPDGTEDWIVYHATSNPANGWKNRKSRAQKFTWNSDGTPDFGIPQALSTPIEVPSGTGQFEMENQIARFEAEYGFINNAHVWENIDASKRWKVGNVDQSDSWIEFRNIRVSAAGAYIIRIGYATAFGARATQYLSVNGLPADVIAYPETGWNNWDSVISTIHLNEGKNIIHLTKGNDSVDIDYIEIYPND